MTAKANYKTKQYEELLAYLKENGGRHITAAEISAHFKAAGKPIGTSTIYRRLEKMVDEGVVKKYNIDQNTPACFEYIGENACTAERCYHYKCEVCSKLVHLHCEEFRLLEAHLLEHHSFVLDPMRTVFYGICAECSAKGAKQPL